MRPRIVRIITRLNVGGPARHVALLNEGLAGRGFDTTLVYGSLAAGEASLEHLAPSGNVHVVRIPELGRPIRLFDDSRALWKLLRVIFRVRPDIVHTHTAKAGTLGRLAAWVFNVTRGRRHRCLVVHTFHGHVLADYFPHAASVTIKWIERSLARGTDRVITISPRQQRDIVETYRLASEARTAVVPLGLDLAPLLNTTVAGLRNDLGIGPGDFVVGYVGRFVPVKDLATLIRGFALVLERRSDAWLLLAGDGPARRSLEKLARDLGVTNRVKWMGWTDNLPAVYATMDVYALTSLNEGTPVAIIEAMAAGKAVVAAAVGGVPDVVEHEATGLLIPPGSVESLSSALDRLGRDVGERRRLAERGRQRAVERYLHTRLVADIDALYRQDLANKRG